jgi:hypothetical protein
MIFRGTNRSCVIEASCGIEGRGDAVGREGFGDASRQLGFTRTGIGDRIGLRREADIVVEERRRGA